MSDDLDSVLSELRAIVTAEERPVATAPELADRLDAGRRQVYDDLRLLERAGDVESYAVGARGRVWWPVDAVTITPPARADDSAADPMGERRDSAVQSGDSATDETTSVPDHTRDTQSEMTANVDDRVQDAVDAVATSWMDSEERLETRRDAAAVVLQHALDTDDAVGKSSDIVDDVRAAFPVEGQKAETYWRKNIRPVLKKHGSYSNSRHGYVVDELED